MSDGIQIPNPAHPSSHTHPFISLTNAYGTGNRGTANSKTLRWESAWYSPRNRRKAGEGTRRGKESD